MSEHHSEGANAMKHMLDSLAKVIVYGVGASAALALGYVLYETFGEVPELLLFLVGLAVFGWALKRVLG